MSKIPKITPSHSTNLIAPNNLKLEDSSRYILFSFNSIDRNEYFNLDGTCQNWASDLFETLQIVSNIEEKDVRAGVYSGRNSTLRIHKHSNAKPPCKIPENISLDELYQIRISKSKGGIHGQLIKNVFYVVWFDPQHNLYPDENHGKLKKIVPPSTCCKERDKEIEDLKGKILNLTKERDALEELLMECENK